MNDLGSSLLALQQADSFFPGGGVAWSWGLETLVTDGGASLETVSSASRATATAADHGRDPVSKSSRRPRHQDRSHAVQAFVEGQLRYRWATFDRVFLHAAWHAADHLPSLLDLDQQVEALTLAEELRQGSRRVGQSLLGVHTALGTSGAAAFQQQVSQGHTPGHLPVIQGMLWRALGLSGEHSQLAAAHSLCTGLASAAVRLGVMGHIDAQRVLAHIQPILLELLATPPASLDDASGFTPLAEIAVMRHETQELRLFAN
ncbi:urease accessory UreF family protein [Pseudomonas sp. dw_358]|uniref:urease accessory protein UreF n=1 Tax=Pseudomonas sp. dw_358 TaxID=2720083 RepID=UPI001BD69372|nr:urease accessory UreF family protein [Pseudomonas sp. dw_358]